MNNMNFGTKGCEYNCGDNCTGECRKKAWEDAIPNLFRLEVKTEEDAKQERLKQASEVSEDMKSEFIFNGEHLYVLGRGHNFIKGFYTEYITKSATVVKRFHDRWFIGGEEYTHSPENGFELVKIKEPTNSEPMDWDGIAFPMVSRVAAKVMSLDLEPVEPMSLSPGDDVNYLFEKFMKYPTNKRAFKNLIQILEAHHIHELAKKENEK